MGAIDGDGFSVLGQVQQLSLQKEAHLPLSRGRRQSHRSPKPSHGNHAASDVSLSHNGAQAAGNEGCTHKALRE